MALLQISEPDEPARREPQLAVGIDLGTTNSLVATVRNRIPVVLPDEKGHPLLPSIVRYGERSVDVGYAAQAHAGARSAQHDRLGEANDGPRPRRSSGCAALSRTGSSTSRGWCKLATRAGVKSPVEISAEILRALRIRAEASLAGKLAGAVVTVPAYFDDAQRQATKDAAKLAGAQRAAAPERADGGGDRLRPRQRGAGHLRHLRSRRRHVRHLHPEAHARRLRGARDERRLGAGRRRLRPSGPLLDARSGRVAAAVARGHALADGEGARGEGESDAASRRRRSTRRCPTAARSSSRSTPRRSPRSRRTSWRRRWVR